MILKQRRRTRDRWVVRVNGDDAYRGTSASAAFLIAGSEAWTNVQVLLNGRQIWPPPDELPLGHL